MPGIELQLHFREEGLVLLFSPCLSHMLYKYRESEAYLAQSQ